MSDSSKANIMVVDDDKALADNLKEFLEKIGYRATAVYGGKEALESSRKASYDLVITDLMMPEMDGVSLIKAIRVSDSKTPVLVITGYGTIESAVQAIRNGAFDFIPKPFKLDELEIIINRALERAQLARQLGLFRGLTLALLISVPIWLLLGILLMKWWR